MSEQELKNVLWDVNYAEISALPADFVIRRVLSYGGVALIAKSTHEYGKNAVKQVFETMKPTSIPPRKYLYLKNFFLV